ncbi:hypothetical protein [Polyangium sorediatum]|uniref:Lipoprotein n=1 Tax=Polyangium sorediatum TaxID=889274 RepID=A0ABT6P871_9BACT|nr:hypothetical protein [Polyangium sorediatum]MDI1436812.1 hypothetical protein [Polyangium sorediatum]
MNAHRWALPLLGGAVLSFVVGCGSSNGDLGLGNGGSGSSSSSASGGSGGAAGAGGAGGEGAGGNGGGNGGSGGEAGAGGGGTTEKFSFFVTSLRALQELSGNPEGFGGDLRFGETGAGAGLRGADKICATIAETSMPGAGQKPWRAFLSATAGEDGQQVNARDRIGEGPWYDRLGRLLAANKTDLLKERPAGADAAIINDFPNEDGVPNHQPDPNQGQVDNHDMLTGTNDEGALFSATATCKDWTSNLGDLASEGRPRVGHSWPRFGGGGGGPGGGDGSAANWMSSLNESGCAPGVNLIEMGGPQPGSVTVGSGGGYGGFYCFSLVP